MRVRLRSCRRAAGSEAECLWKKRPFHPESGSSWCATPAPPVRGLHRMTRSTEIRLLRRGCLESGPEWHPRGVCPRLPRARWPRSRGPSAGGRACPPPIGFALRTNLGRRTRPSLRAGPSRPAPGAGRRRTRCHPRTISASSTAPQSHGIGLNYVMGRRNVHSKTSHPSKVDAADQTLLGEAKAITDAARQHSIHLRLLGAVAIHLRCGDRGQVTERLNRLGGAGALFSDLDFAAYGVERAK